jgi:hypothetical protein
MKCVNFIVKKYNTIWLLQHFLFAIANGGIRTLNCMNMGQVFDHCATAHSQLFENQEDLLL